VSCPSDDEVTSLTGHPHSTTCPQPDPIDRNA